jgi:uncharacterized cupredoxin-like copper-binding protein
MIKKILLCLMMVMVYTGCSNQEVEQTKPVEQVEKQEVITVTVSKNNGEEVITEKEVEVKEGQTVMEVMQESFELETAYEGTFIVGIDGLIADEAKKESWFYSVNGEEAMVGAAEYKLKPGDKVEFDLHNWE